MSDIPTLDAAPGPPDPLPPDHHPGPRPPQGGGLGVWKWVLIGCGGLMLLTGAVVCGGLMYARSWLTEEHTPVDGRTLATADTCLAVMVDASPDHADTIAALEAIVAAHQAQNPPDPEAQKMMRWMGHQDADALVKAMLPIHIGVLTDRQHQKLMFISISRHANPIRQLFEAFNSDPQNATNVATVGGVAVYRLGDDTFHAMATNTYLRADTRLLLEDALRVLTGAGGGASATPPEIASRLKGGPIRVAMIDREGFLAKWLAETTSEETGRPLEEEFRAIGLTADQIDAARMSGSVGPNEFKGRWTVELAETADPAAVQRGMDELLKHLVRAFLEDDLELEQEATLSGRNLDVRYTVKNMDRVWQRWAERASEQQQSRPVNPQGPGSTPSGK